LSEAYLEVRKTSQTHVSGLLAEEAHEYSARFFTLFSVFLFLSEADKGSDYRAVTGGTARYLL